jgi:hypothetical protein
MSHQEFASCIEACNACADACDHCTTACLAEADPKTMARCIALDIDCAQICRMASAYMARGSEHMATLCTLCADICDACGKECKRHSMEHCQKCAAACQHCAEECRRMVQQVHSHSSASPAAHAAH